MKKPKKMKGRPRGGASVPCPRCGRNTEVLITRRDDVLRTVDRTRRCSRGHKFHTEERVVP